jgi:NAD(P)-dependent dehydrogenase (short-subunit alcohol dehydrogenase family)
MQNKIVLITGGTGGIGKQTALTLAKMGARIIITGRAKTSGDETVAEIKQASGFIYWLSDLTKNGTGIFPVPFF